MKTLRWEMLQPVSLFRSSVLLSYETDRCWKKWTTNELLKSCASPFLADISVSALEEAEPDSPRFTSKLFQKSQGLPPFIHWQK